MGLFIERRRFFWLAGGAAAISMGRSARAAAPAALSWKEFVDRGPDLAELAADHSAAGEDAYLYTLAALAVRLTGVPEVPLFPFKPRAPLVSLAPIHRGRPFVVIEWKMEPGATLPAHNHPGYSVCTLGLDGEARLRHYQPPADAPPFDSRAPFRVRSTREQRLAAGSISTLAPGRDNIHTFTAGPQGARGIDIGTLHADADHGFSFLDIDEAAGPDGDHQARWSGT
jgi:hypothetical protein